MGITSKISNFLKGVISELRKVKWPTRREAINLTLIVIVSVAIATGIIIGIDWILSRILETIVI